MLVDDLKHVVVSGVRVNLALKLFRLLAESTPCDLDDFKKAVEKKLGLRGISPTLLHLIDSLVSRGLLVRGKLREFELINKVELLKAVGVLEDYLSDKLVVPNGFGTRRGWPRGEYSETKHFFFIRRGHKIISMDKIAVEVLKDHYEYLIVPKEEFNDLILLVQIFKMYGETRHMSVSFDWIDPVVFLDDKIEYYSDEIRIPGDYRVGVERNELTSYQFDVEKLIEIDLSGVHEKDMFLRKVLVFIDRIFSVKGDVGDHSRICSALEGVAKILGIEASHEFELSDSSRIDVVYFSGGELSHAFEVVLEGSLREAFYKLGLVKARRKILVVKRDRLDEAAKTAPQGIEVIEAEIVRNIESSLNALVELLEKIK